jgi:hypothetical protein
MGACHHITSRKWEAKDLANSDRRTLFRMHIARDPCAALFPAVKKTAVFFTDYGRLARSTQILASIGKETQ